MVQVRCGRCTTADPPVLLEVKFERWSSGKETVKISRPVRIPDNQVAPKRFRSGPLVTMDRKTRQLHIADFNPNAEGSAARTIRERVQGPVVITVCPRCKTPYQPLTRSRLLGKARAALNEGQQTVYLRSSGRGRQARLPGSIARPSRGRSRSG
jgi:hypothetical protein